MIYSNILETVGNTPIVKLNRIAPKGINIFGKVESFNPMGSVKDRLALAMIEDAERKGVLKPGQTVIEATSGNTGISLAMVCATKGYPFVATMVETFSLERRKIMKALGAKVLLTPAKDKASGMVELAEKLAKENGWFLAKQFENQANPAYHRNTTAPEILRDFAGKTLDYFVSGYGTGGTITGVSEVLKIARPDLKVIAAEPKVAALLGGSDWQPHKIQGWTPDFIPKVFNRDVIDEVIAVSDEKARDISLALARKEGLFVGISAGATLAAALQKAKSVPQGSSFLVMLPDTGERYLSSFLFDGISVDSDVL